MKRRTGSAEQSAGGTRHGRDAHARWLSYAVSGSAVLAAGPVEATIIYNEVEPDLVATTTNPGSYTDGQRVVMDFSTYNESPKGEPAVFRPSVNAYVAGGSNTIGASSLALVPATVGSIDNGGGKGSNVYTPAHVVTGENVNVAVGLGYGTLVGPGLNWSAGVVDHGKGSSYPASVNQVLELPRAGANKGGPAADNYLGFRYSRSSKSPDSFYGWLQYDFSGGDKGSSGTRTVSLLAYALENELNQGIAVGDRGVEPIPEPDGIALLVGGAAGVATLRRRRLTRARAAQAA